jgi:hypothetical protein
MLKIPSFCVLCVACYFFHFVRTSFKTHTDTMGKTVMGIDFCNFGSRLFDRPSQQARGHHVAAVDPLGLKYADLHAAFSNRKGAPSELVVRNYMLGKGSPLGKASVWNFSILFD